MSTTQGRYGAMEGCAGVGRHITQRLVDDEPRPLRPAQLPGRPGSGGVDRVVQVPSA